MRTAIEQSILATLIYAYSYLSRDEAKAIHSININKDFFSFYFHKKLFLGIQRLKELDLPIDEVLLREKFVNGNKWTLQEDNMLIELLTHNCLTLNSFKSYLSILEDKYKRDEYKSLLD